MTYLPPGLSGRWSWLDLARYADSKGYADDQPRSIWRYRDYVIEAFNRNVPFDQFTVEQLAGDLLPNPTEDQVIATGFHRNTMTNTEGGTDDEEFRVSAVIDRVNTTMSVWMGTSMACAQCHTHKYDPLTDHEYFQVYAIFNQTEDADRADEAPLYEFLTAEQQRTRTDAGAEIAALLKTMRATQAEHTAAANTWARFLPGAAGLELFEARSLEARERDDGDGGRLGPRLYTGVRKKATTTLDVPVEVGAAITAFRIQALPHETLQVKVRAATRTATSSLHGCGRA